MSIPATTNTAYKWSFASKRSRADDDALQTARERVSAATYGREISSHELGSSSRASGSGRVKGPTLPSASDLTLAREMNAEQQDEMRAHKRKREKAEAKERVEDAVGPKEVGREGMLEKKRAKRENDRAFRERGDDGLELDESTLLGGGDSFKDQCVLAARPMGYILTSPSGLQRGMRQGNALKTRKQKRGKQQHGNEPTPSKRRRRSVILIPWISHILNDLSITGNDGHVPAAREAEIWLITNL